MDLCRNSTGNPANLNQKWNGNFPFFTSVDSGAAWHRTVVQELATLLEGAGYNFKIFECEFQKINFLWYFSCKKLDNEYTRACVRSSGSSKLLILLVNNDENVKNVHYKYNVVWISW